MTQLLHVLTQLLHVLAAALTTAGLSTAAPSAQPGSEHVALRNATVHTFEPGDVPAVRTVLLENDRIVAIGADVEIPADAEVHDLAGLHLLPGLVDGMVNFDADHDALYLSAGVTLVRDAGNDFGRIGFERTRAARERGPGPWIWSAGAPLDGPRPATLAAFVLGDPATDGERLDALLGLDEAPDYLSFLPGLPVESWKLALSKAHARGKAVWGTVPRGVTLREALEAGQDGVFHLDAFLPSGKSWETAQPEDFTAGIEVAAQRKVGITPTLGVLARAIAAPRETSPDLDVLSPFYRETWLADAAARRSVTTPEVLQRGMAALAAQKALVKRLHDAGVPLVPGSAAPNPWIVPGESLLHELDLWRGAGIPVEACVRAATAVACEEMGATLRGTIRTAKYADLIAVRSDPRTEIGALHRPEFVVVRGKVLARGDLDSKLAELRTAQARARAELEKPLEVEAPPLPAGDVILKGRVETRAIGLRVSAERFAVVRRFDGALVYTGRVRTPGQATTVDTETLVTQVVEGGALASFEVSIRTGMRHLEVRGESGGGRMTVAVKLDGLPVRNDPVSSRLALVDCGSATAWLVLGYHRKPGAAFQVLFFDDLDPAFGPWEMALDPDGSTHYLRMYGNSQQAIVRYDARGFPTEVVRTSGNGQARTTLLESEVLDGRGLPMPADKKSLAPKSAAAPVEAGSGAPR